MTLVYLGLIPIPIGIGADPAPACGPSRADLVSDLPRYVKDLNETVQEQRALKDLNENFDLRRKLEDWASHAAGELDDVAGVLADIGAGLVGSLFALFTILVMSMFMVARGRGWTDAVLQTRPEHEARSIQPGARPHGGRGRAYVGGALLQATLAGFAASSC